MSLRIDQLGWHAGEQKMQALMNAPSDMTNFTSSFLTPYGARLLQQAPLLAVGTMDSQERIWTTILGGDRGFARPLASSIMALKALVDRRFDPAVQALFDSQEVTEAREANRGQEVAALSIDLATRSRVKLAGKVIAGGIIQPGKQADESRLMDFGELQLAIKVESSLGMRRLESEMANRPGNCPKYLNKKDIIPTLPEPRLLAHSLPLPQEGVDFIRAVDLFFLTSSVRGKHLSTNHRGGPPGFVRVLSNSSSRLELAFPEYSGNRMYQTLGNLQLDPSVGLVFPNFGNGNVLYLSGFAEVLVEDAAADLIPGQNLVMKLSITSLRFVQHGLAFRGSAIDYSPYNPQVRYLASEKAPEKRATSSTAELISKDIICPRIARFRFRVKDAGGPPAIWKPGQYAALSFANHFDRSYSHMRDDDPKSLNDDYIRTFTVSSPPSSFSNLEFELTIRQFGKATDLLFNASPSAHLTLDFLGFAGDFAVDQTHDTRPTTSIAGGIGITALLGHLSALDPRRLRLFWAMQVRDLALVADTLARHPALAPSTRLFLSGAVEFGCDAAILRALRAKGVTVQMRRLAPKDLVGEQDAGDRFYLCVSPVFRKQLMKWLEGKECLYEDYGF